MMPNANSTDSDFKIRIPFDFRPSVLVFILPFLLLSAFARTDEPPVIPVGFDAYRLWDRWPQQRIGARAYMRRTTGRFRDDEFLIGPDLTRGRSEIRLRVKFTPLNIPLLPGQALPELAWTELRYDAYCFVLPAQTP
jgi:hypothetical protein